VGDGVEVPARALSDGCVAEEAVAPGAVRLGAGVAVGRSAVRKEADGAVVPRVRQVLIGVHPGVADDHDVVVVLVVVVDHDPAVVSEGRKEERRHVRFGARSAGAGVAEEGSEVVEELGRPREEGPGFFVRVGGVLALAEVDQARAQRFVDEGRLAWDRTSVAPQRGARTELRLDRLQKQHGALQALRHRGLTPRKTRITSLLW